MRKSEDKVLRDAAFSLDDVVVIVKSILESSQASAQSAQQSTQQTGQASQEQAVKGSAQEKQSTAVSTSETKMEEILGAEAIRAGVVSGTRLWNANDKYIFEKSQDYDRALKNFELKEKALEIAEREAKLRKQASLDAIEISEREFGGLMKAFMATDTMNFRTAAHDPISPNAKTSEE